MTQALRVGVAGCGRMGLPMARSLHRAGFDVRGFDIRPVREFGDFAPRMMENPAAFAGHPEVLFTVVRDQRQTEELLFDVQALFRRDHAIRILTVCSTLSPRYIHDLAARLLGGVRLVDAPMSGAAVAAEEGRLSFMLGGAERDLDAIDPMLRAMGHRFHRMGPVGAGMTVKVLNNFVASSSTAAVRLVLDWADRLGVDEARLLAVMHDSSGQTWFGSGFDRIEFARDGYDAENTIGILKKDVESALDALELDDREGLPDAVINALLALKPRPKTGG
jgi:3-hydroxyisobutyrate dehydrogenase-like beta-hydroxyacid dehydrogenase